jgi:hypothetical protein
MIPDVIAYILQVPPVPAALGAVLRHESLGQDLPQVHRTESRPQGPFQDPVVALQGIEDPQPATPVTAPPEVVVSVLACRTAEFHIRPSRGQLFPALPAPVFRRRFHSSGHIPKYAAILSEYQGIQSRIDGFLRFLLFRIKLVLSLFRTESSGFRDFRPGILHSS